MENWEPVPPERRLIVGSSLANVTEVVMADGTKYPAAKGAFMWPNGWVTVYFSDSQNEGKIFPPSAVHHLVFGTAES